MKYGSIDRSFSRIVSQAACIGRIDPASRRAAASGGLFKLNPSGTHASGRGNPPG